MQNVQIREYSMLLACGCIIGAQLSHWHGSNLCLQALKSAVTGWNNNCVLWLLTGASSESLQKETTASHRTNRQFALELHVRRIVYIDSQSKYIDIKSIISTKLHQLSACPSEVRNKRTCPQPGALHTKGRSSPIFAKSLQCNCGRGAEENIVVVSLWFANW